ncbi:DOMON domain and Cellobiose dehydrogenase, cytochrome domain-containing protein [Strongyloides ratti]|uniref:DOMON domain and Cellobiose dehydrogenase, cytochrome domain-containing protein n=1 Tax=Strongyloides ratti TaxID=34506 RepID=A0A090L8U1_STRRB|nr:DOMON domain and Cellobiose dehydrogenase, cytochrome domain-containing protein [Strongyloides ratti]CEF64558.1 DOMON domain and Cellobiose dehydrogenase, cytochrome domain-containing protein [Strongyloides ratti]
MKSAPPNPGISSTVDVSGKGDPCSFKGKDYSISWYYDKSTTNVFFEYDSPIKSGKWWSAIGIGDNMSDMDIAVVYLDDGNVVDIVDHYSSSYAPPIKDENQDWKLINTSFGITNGRTKYVVARKMYTGDDKKDKNMDNCVLFQFGVNLAEYGVKNGELKIKKHENWPDLYKACEIKDKCIKETPIIEKAADAAVISIPQETIINSNKKSSLITSGPSKCKSAGLKYTSHWNYIKANDSIEFVLNFETSPEKSWSAITFGTNPKRDAFILFTNNRKIVDGGDYVLKNFSELKKDRQQDWHS